MYKLLIVDDEEIEREGMAQFIPWEEYGIELAGTAWNGVEGFEKIQTEHPDIVLTDIKMPVMDGISLIRKTKENFPDIEFIVLSGYGEYEFTSQAMEEGVRYYILKPCDEEKIVEVLDKVKQGIREKREQKQKAQEYSHRVRKLLPRAKEQLFRNMLLDRETLKEDYQMFLDEFGTEHQRVRVLALHLEDQIDYLEQFVLGNILGELLGEQSILLASAIGQNVLFLLRDCTVEQVEPALARTRTEFRRVTANPMTAAISEEGELSEIPAMYGQILELFRMGVDEEREPLFHYGMFKDIGGEKSSLIDYQRIRCLEDYGEILFEIYLTFIKMELEQYSFEQKKEMCTWILKVLYGKMFSTECGEGDDRGCGDCREEEDESWKLFRDLTEQIAVCQGIAEAEEKEERRVKSILLEVYRYLKEPDLNIRFLAKEVLFMNEDYFGRIFLKSRKIKFSTFLLETRITLAQRILDYKPDIRISQLAELVGYAPDGQYFSKAFKKVSGVSPTEYRDRLVK